LTVGTARIALIREPDGGYHYESHSWPARWAGLFQKDRRHETSSGRLQGASIRPDKYRYLRTGGSKERAAHLTFDWDKGQVVNNVAGSRWKMHIPAGTQDKLSTQLGMMLALARGTTDFSFAVADGGTLKKFHYKVVGEETLELPAGTFRTVKVMNTRDDDRYRSMAWCAPALNYLPVRIRRREKDETEYTSELEHFSEALRVNANRDIAVPRSSPTEAGMGK
ncbi:MAG: DUF3108 domain-containing protein, partial [Thiohalobacterales bacterium]|nr:DUF3108 domain-containing protein [Thiohalobacterales bacterium]